MKAGWIATSGASLAAAWLLTGCGTECFRTVETRPCSEAELEAAQAASRLYSDLGFSASFQEEGITTGTVVSVENEVVHLVEASSGEAISFRWHASLEGLFREGEEVEATRSGSWSVLRSASQSAALLSASLRGDFENSSAPGGAPSAKYFAQCSTLKEDLVECDEKADLVVLQLVSTIEGRPVAVERGMSDEHAGWSVAHLDGRWLPKQQEFRAVTAFLSPTP